MLQNRLYSTLLLNNFQNYIYKSGKYVKFVRQNQEGFSMRYFYQAIFFSVCLLMASCGPATQKGSPSASNDTQVTKAKKENGANGEIYIAVDETFRSIVDSQISTFMGKYQGATIHPIYLPGEEAISAMLENDSIRMVISMRELSGIEKAYLKEQNTSAKTTLIGTDAIALITHKANKDTIFTQKQIKGILSGQIASWKEINPESSLGEIKIVFDNPLSSTVQFLQDSVLALDNLKLTEKNVFGGQTNEEVLRYVTRDKNALGIIGLAWISDVDDKERALFRRDSINVLMLEYLNPCSFKGTFFQPYQAYIHQGCYPYTRGVYAILRETFWGLGHGFVAYMASDPGQRIIHKAGLVPELAMKRIVRMPSKRERAAAEAEN